MIAVEVKGRNPKFAWEVVEVYRAPIEVMRVNRKISSQDWVYRILY